MAKLDLAIPKSVKMNQTLSDILSKTSKDFPPLSKVI